MAEFYVDGSFVNKLTKEQMDELKKALGLSGDLSVQEIHKAIFEYRLAVAEDEIFKTGQNVAFCETTKCTVQCSCNTNKGWNPATGNEDPDEYYFVKSGSKFYYAEGNAPIKVKSSSAAASYAAMSNMTPMSAATPYAANVAPQTANSQTVCVKKKPQCPNGYFKRYMFDEQYFVIEESGQYPGCYQATGCKSPYVSIGMAPNVWESKKGTPVHTAPNTNISCAKEPYYIDIYYFGNNGNPINTNLNYAEFKLYTRNNNEDESNLRCTLSSGTFTDVACPDISNITGKPVSMGYNIYMGFELNGSTYEVSSGENETRGNDIISAMALAWNDLLSSYEMECVKDYSSSDDGIFYETCTIKKSGDVVKIKVDVRNNCPNEYFLEKPTGYDTTYFQLIEDKGCYTLACQYPYKYVSNVNAWKQEKGTPVHTAPNTNISCAKEPYYIDIVYFKNSISTNIPSDPTPTFTLDLEYDDGSKDRAACFARTGNPAPWGCPDIDVFSDYERYSFEIYFKLDGAEYRLSSMNTSIKDGFGHVVFDSIEEALSEAWRTLFVSNGYSQLKKLKCTNGTLSTRCTVGGDVINITLDVTNNSCPDGYSQEKPTGYNTTYFQEIQSDGCYKLECKSGYSATGTGPGATVGDVTCKQVCPTSVTNNTQYTDYFNYTLVSGHTGCYIPSCKDGYSATGTGPGATVGGVTCKKDLSNSYTFKFNVNQDADANIVSPSEITFSSEEEFLDKIVSVRAVSLTNEYEFEDWETKCDFEFVGLRIGNGDIYLDSWNIGSYEDMLKSCGFTENRTQTMTAQFNKRDQKYFLTFEAIGRYDGTVSPTKYGFSTYKDLQKVIATATPKSGYEFVKWYPKDTSVQNEIYKTAELNLGINSEQAFEYFLADMKFDEQHTTQTMVAEFRDENCVELSCTEWINETEGSIKVDCTTDKALPQNTTFELSVECSAKQKCYAVDEWGGSRDDSDDEREIKSSTTKTVNAGARSFRIEATCPLLGTSDSHGFGDFHCDAERLTGLRYTVDDGKCSPWAESFWYEQITAFP